MKKIMIPIMISALVLSGCAANTDDLGADVYDSAQLNQEQQTKTINIISILPVKVAVDNSNARANAQLAGTIVGGILGAVSGHQFGRSGDLAGAGLGAVAGAAVGSAVKDKTIVEGVSLTYKDGNQLLTSTQAGRQCQFKYGLALVIRTKYKETRVQPNAECPAAPMKKSLRGRV